ncbi:MAG: hypothetical protein GEV09_12040 [Pseudonocardiaceae bacterium]|nr:hypothetical protein [Pseudonocardiaceae bacterium]
MIATRRRRTARVHPGPTTTGTAAWTARAGQRRSPARQLAPRPPAPARPPAPPPAPRPRAPARQLARPPAPPPAV